MTSRNAKAKPTCESLIKWLSMNLGRSALGALTGTDYRALEAAVHILALRAYGGDERVLAAFRIVVLQMQPHTRQFAYHAIAQMGEWEDRATVWAAAALPAFDRVWICEGEPAGRHRREATSSAAGETSDAGSSR